MRDAAAAHRAPAGRGPSGPVRLICAVAGYALILLGCAGLALLSAGAFPEPVRELLLGRPPERRLAVAPEPYVPGATGPQAPPDVVASAVPGDGRESSAALEGPEHASPVAPDETPAGETADAATAEEQGAAADLSTEAPPTATPPPPTPTPSPAPTVKPVPLAAGPNETPITRLRVASIRLDAEVVPARLVTQGGVTTWEVPAFRVGHGVFTAGAGATGNAVLVGHVVSVSQGNVFRSLDHVRVGDAIQVLSGDREYGYLTTEVKRVPRTDLSIYAPTSNATVTLVTCTGTWLSDLYDYAERLAVRAVLVATPQPPTATATATSEATATESPTETFTPEPTSIPTATATRPAAPTATLPPPPPAPAQPAPPLPTATPAAPTAPVTQAAPPPATATRTASGSPVATGATTATSHPNQVTATATATPKP